MKQGVQEVCNVEAYPDELMNLLSPRPSFFNSLPVTILPP